MSGLDDESFARVVAARGVSRRKPCSPTLTTLKTYCLTLAILTQHSTLMLTTLMQYKLFTTVFTQYSLMMTAFAQDTDDDSLMMIVFAQDTDDDNAHNVQPHDASRCSHSTGSLEHLRH